VSRRTLGAVRTGLGLLIGVIDGSTATGFPPREDDRVTIVVPRVKMGFHIFFGFLDHPPGPRMIGRGRRARPISRRACAAAQSRRVSRRASRCSAQSSESTSIRRLA